MVRLAAGALRLLVLVIALQVPAWAQSDLARQVQNLPWQMSGSGSVANVATVSLNPRLQFLDSVSSSRFLELNGNPPRSGNYVLATRPINWFAVFAFDPSGYVRDDERLDPDDLLRTLQRNNEAGAAERRRLGYPVLRLTGWAVPPHYDVQTRRLEWGTRLVTEQGEPVVNYTIRILGRSGVMSATLVSEPQSLNADIADFRQALQGFSFIPGERYTEFRQGDRIAQYGLAALVVGGAAAAAASSGALKGLGKLIGFGAIAALAGIGAFVKRLFRRKSPT